MQLQLHRRPAVWLAAALLSLLVWACLAPLRAPSRERLLELGEQRGPVQSVLRLTLGVQDVLLLRNNSVKPQVFGQLRILPGHVFRLPFEQTGEFDFACSDRPRGQVLVQVVAPPDPGLARLRWRFVGLVETLRYMPPIAPLTT